MDDILRRDFPNQWRSWKTVRTKIQAYSGIKVQYYDYCPSSHKLLYESDEERPVKCLHRNCRDEQFANNKLMYIRLRERLISMLRCAKMGPEIVSYVKDGYKRQKEEKDGTLEDFYSGKGFKVLADTLEDFCVPADDHNGARNVHMFLFISTDGAPAFRSSTKSFWPVIVFLGNITPSKRYQDRNVLPVMCIPGNPTDLESFLKPLFDELEELNKGISCTLWDGSTANMFCHIVHELSDLPARRKLCLLKGSNGYSPCSYCEIQGVRSPSNNTIYYPSYIRRQKRNSTTKEYTRRISLWSIDKLPLRKKSKIRRQFRKIKLLHQKGSKGDAAKFSKETGIIGEAEIFRRFQSLQTYMSLPIDLMHLLFENIAPQIIGIWLGQIDTGGDHSYLLGPDVLKKVNDILRECGSGISDSIRRPRDISQKGLWKADEWRTFVVTTSLVALHQILPSIILNGWYYFVQICEISMRPNISTEEFHKLSSLCKLFFTHNSNTNYNGRADRIHLMKYTIHLILHIPHSTKFCGPLVCLSQFSTERYIGIIKEQVSAKYRFCESVSLRWLFQQSVMMCESLNSGLQIFKNASDNKRLIRDERSKASDREFYEGFFLKGPCCEYKIEQLDAMYEYSVKKRLENYYCSTLCTSRSNVKHILDQYENVTVWDRLVVQRADEWVARKYRKYTNNVERSAAFIVGEFESSEEGIIDVYYGRIEFFLEHSFINPLIGRRDTRILVAASWTSRGIRTGLQQQLFVNGERNGSAVFQTTTVEDVRCIRRNLVAIERPCYVSTRRSRRTYLVDENKELDELLVLNSLADDQKRVLRGLL